MSEHVQQALLTTDEMAILLEYRKLKKEGHGDLTVEVGGETKMDISVKSHGLVKLWTTHKRDLGGVSKLKEAGQ